MQKLTLLICCCLAWAASFGQTTTADTTIHFFADQMPLFIGCANYDTTYQAKYQCTQDKLLEFIYTNVQYPLKARQQGLEGTVVVSFVIEKDSTISQAKVVKDIGGDCGAAALYVVNAMNEIGVRWIPALVKDQPARVQMTVPVKFRLKELPPYSFVENDTVYTEVDTRPIFKKGEEALIQQLNTQLNYPAIGNDSCSVGYMDLSLLIQPNGVVKVLTVLDYYGLGTDFQFAAIEAATATSGQWTAATYKERDVPSTYDIRMDFSPTATEACRQTIQDFNRTIELTAAGFQAYNQQELALSTEQFTQALSLFPNNAEVLAARGQIHLDQANFTAACEDFTKTKSILGGAWYDTLIQVVCKPREE